MNIEKDNCVSNVLILDNGAYDMKVGYYTDSQPKLLPNCITKIKSERRRQFISDQISDCKDLFGTFYNIPFRKGYLVNWENERKIWDYAFQHKFGLHREKDQRFDDTGIIFTEPVYNFRNIREGVLELLFEDYGFGEVFLTTASDLAAYRYFYEENFTKDGPKEFGCCVVDSGYSFSHVTPFLFGHKILQNTRRINIGGKILTNYLKDVISYRQLNLLEETYIVNKMKEDCCFFSKDLQTDLETCRKTRNNPLKLEYVLPDFINLKNGFILDRKDPKQLELITPDNQIVHLSNERFQTPELLFYPSDVNIDQAGIADTIVHAISQFKPESDKPSNESTEASNANEPKTTIEPPAKVERPSMREISTDEDDSQEEDKAPEEPVKRKSTKRQTEFAQRIESMLDSIDLSFINDENLQPPLYRNIVAIGGNCVFPNFHRRLYTELRSRVSNLLNVRIKVPDNPVDYAWYGAKLMCTSNITCETADLDESLFHARSITKKQYKELGLSLTGRYFGTMKTPLCVDFDLDEEL